MDVYTLDKPLHNWRDFFIHIGTITIGLLMALGLEQTVAFLHHEHQRHTAERNLRREFEANRAILRKNEQQLAISEAQIAALAQALSVSHGPGQAAAPAWPQWHWSNFLSTAWDTVRSSNATALMPFDEVQRLDAVYTQQSVVNAQSALYIKDIYNVDMPSLESRRVDQLSPDDLAALGANLHRTTSDLMYLLDLCHSLESIYKSDPLTESGPASPLH